MDEKLQKYLVDKGITDSDKLFIKSAEIDVLLAIIASDPSCPDLNSGLDLQWGKIIDGEVTKADKEFIRTKWGN